MPTLDWIGKNAALNHHREVPYHFLKCDKGLSVRVASWLACLRAVEVEYGEVPGKNDSSLSEQQSYSMKGIAWQLRNHAGVGA